MSFQLANLKGAHVPRTVTKPVADGEDFQKGALLLVDANGEYAEVGANPAAVAAVANSGVGPRPDTFGNPLGADGFPPGEVVATGVANGIVFSAEYVGTLPEATGGTYGVVRGADGKWRVDFAVTGASARVRLLEIGWTETPLNKGRVLVSFLPDNVQLV